MCNTKEKKLDRLRITVTVSAVSRGRSCWFGWPDMLHFYLVVVGARSKRGNFNMMGTNCNCNVMLLDARRDRRDSRGESAVMEAGRARHGSTRSYVVHITTHLTSRSSCVFSNVKTNCPNTTTCLRQPIGSGDPLDKQKLRSLRMRPYSQTRKHLRDSALSINVSESRNGGRLLTVPDCFWNTMSISATLS